MTISSLQPSSASTTPAWMRWMFLWHGIFYVTLIFATSVDLIEGSQTWQHTVTLLGLALVFGLWYGVCVVISPLFWYKHPLLTMSYLAVGWMLWFGLTELDPVYLFVLTGLYPQVFALAPLPGKILGAFVLTALTAWQQVTVAGKIDGNLFLTLAAAISGIVMALFINAIVEQSQQQRRLISELEETRSALAAAERQTGIIEERQRLAREIHDTLAQGFTSIVMHLEAADASFPDELRTLQRHLDQARRTARENLAEARRMLWALQPVALDRASLAEALTSLAARWTEESGVKADVTITGTIQTLLPETEVTLLRAAQETLANARKYAKASQVSLTLSYIDGTVVLDVQDDGVGFDMACLCISQKGQTAGGFGLKSLRKRVEQLGGVLSIESAPAEGTTIAVALPAVSNESSLSQEVAEEVC